MMIWGIFLFLMKNKLGWPNFLQQKNVSHLSFKQKSMMYFSRTIFTISGYRTWVCKLTKYVHKFFFISSYYCLYNVNMPLTIQIFTYT